MGIQRARRWGWSAQRRRQDDAVPDDRRDERPDDGQVTVDPGMTIGYMSQDVGEMSGMSAVAAVMDGVGPVSALATEMAKLEAAMVDPEQGDKMDALIERYGEVQRRFEELDGTRWMPGRARCWRA